MKFSHLSETVKIKKISEKNNAGVFEIDGLFSGYGLTVGNALRRALLSSLPGAAITQVKIKGANNEFSTISGVMEDVVEIIGNLKNIRFKVHTDEPQTLELRVKGEAEVTAGDIKTNPQVEIINPKAHIAALSSKNAELEAELIVERGMGYAPSEMRKVEKLPIGALVIDAFFSPVLKVNFVVENTRVGERTDYNRLVFDIETDGTISPSVALHKAANILKDHFNKISQIEGGEEAGEEVAEEEKIVVREKKEKTKAAKKTKKK